MENKMKIKELKRERIEKKINVRKSEKNTVFLFVFFFCKKKKN